MKGILRYCAPGAFILIATICASASANIGWSIVTSPNTSASQENELNAVTCAAANDCWAVGYFVNSSPFAGTQHTLIEHWNGTSWSITTSPNRASLSNVLNAVTCVSSSDCWAVGMYNSGSVLQALSLHWDGTAWSVVLVQDATTTADNVFNSVACNSTNDCWAVGYYVIFDPDGDPFNQTLIEHWNGTQWLVTSSPDTSNIQDNLLQSVTCSSTSNCWAVGWYIDSGVGFNYGNQVLIARWNGTSWTIFSTPVNTSSQRQLFGVTCRSAADCWGVGFFENSSFVDQTLTEHWDGNSWTAVTSADTAAATSNVLLSVSCPSSSDCWAAGGFGSTNQTLAEQWNGSSWSIVSSPNTSSSQSNDLNGVTCASGWECWTVGYYFPSSGTAQTLIEEYVAPMPLISSIARLSNGHVQLQCVGVPNVPNSVQSSPDLVTGNFGTIAMPSASADGTFQFDDASVASATKEFYRLSFP